MSKHGKKYKVQCEKVDSLKSYPLDDALALVKELASAKFDETLEIAINLGVNPKYSDQMVRGAAVMPHGTGKTVRVAVFAKGDKAKEAEEAGADIIGAEDLAEKIQGGFIDFDKTIATPDMMKVVGRLGRALGPRGLMPNPKAGTVTFDIGKAVADSKAGKVEYRTDRTAIIHMAIGKISFSEADLLDNYGTVIDEIIKAKPASAKGRYIKSVTMTTTMGPGVRVDSSIVKDFME